jgi:hypothetical protein
MLNISVRELNPPWIQEDHILLGRVTLRTACQMGLNGTCLVEGILMMEIQEVEEAPKEEDLPTTDGLPEDLEMDILIEEYLMEGLPGLDLQMEEHHHLEPGGPSKSPSVPMLITSQSLSWNSILTTCQNTMGLIMPSSHGWKIWITMPQEARECMNNWLLWPPCNSPSMLMCGGEACLTL